MKERKKTPWIKLVGKPLPKRVLRPFVYVEPFSLDDKRYVFVSTADGAGFIMAFSVLMYVVVAGAGLLSVISKFREPVAIAVTIIAFVVALALHYQARAMKPRKFAVFDREAGTVQQPRGVFTKKVIEAPWDEWSGRLWVQSTYSGIPRHALSLVHRPSYKLWELHTDLIDTDSLLGIWSFLVQYMDKEGPLPDVPELKDYPNRTQGLGTWKEWEENYRTPDPYSQWLVKLKANPELDIINSEVEKSRGW